jgi:hypothetical protein
MITMMEPGRQCRVTGNSPTQIEDELSTAVVLIHQHAHEVRHGILVTRLDPGTYTVALDPAVPYGMTDERDT